MILPCPRSQWEAKSAGDWVRARQANICTSPGSNNHTGYLPGLHPDFQVNTVTEGFSAAILTLLGSEPLPFKIDGEGYLGAELVLLGLMAAAWDCRTRGGMGLKMRENKQWRGMMLSGA